MLHAIYKQELYQFDLQLLRHITCITQQTTFHKLTSYKMFEMLNVQNQDVEKVKYENLKMIQNFVKLMLFFSHVCFWKKQALHFRRHLIFH